MAKPKPNNANILVGLGERIRKLRKKRGWTQEIMAEKIGMDRSFIADLERGKAKYYDPESGCAGSGF